MILNRIKVKNFYRYGSIEQELNIDGNGITAIVGLNGNGKSTITVDAINFVFFAKGRTNSLDDVVNKYTKKDCKVTIDFTVDGEQYTAIRYRKHTTHNNSAYLFKGDQDISGHTITETNALIIDLIKFNYTSFTNSMVFSSELYSEFLGLSNVDRLKVFENILSLKEINEFYESTKNILKEKTKLEEDEKLKLSAKDAEIKAINDVVINYSSTAKSKLLELKTKKQELNNKIQDAKNKILELSTIDVKSERVKLANKVLFQSYMKSADSLKKEEESLKVEIPANDLLIYNKYQNVNFEENKLKEQKYNEDLALIQTRENGIKAGIEQINTFLIKKGSLSKEKDSYEREIKDSLDKLEKLQLAICPYCGQHLTSDRVEEDIKKYNAKVESDKSSLNEVEKEIEDIKVQKEQIAEDNSYLQKDILDIKSRLDSDFIKNSDVEEQKYIAAKNNVESLREKITKNDERLKEIQKEKEELKTLISNLSISTYSEEDLNSIESKLDNYNAVIVESEKDIAAINASVSSVYDKSYIEKLNKQVEEKKKEKAIIDNNLSAIDKEVLHYEFLKDCFSNKSGGFKKYFIGEMIDMFNQKVNQYLPFFFSEDISIKFDKDLSEEITVDDMEFHFSGFSQGQRQRAELSVDFALFDIARYYFNTDSNLLILDELDKGLDKYGIKAMVKVLRGMENEMKIFVVSHNPLLEEEIDDKIIIDRENNFSVIKHA